MSELNWFRLSVASIMAATYCVAISLNVLIFKFLPEWFSAASITVSILVLFALTVNGVVAYRDIIKHWDKY